MFRPGVVSPTLLLLATLAVLAPQCAAEPPEPWIHGVFIGRSPVPSLDSRDGVWRRANALAAETPGAFVLAGGGDSMRPLYADGTVLVCRTLPYPALARGMTALYRNRANRVVAHVLVAKSRDGWRATGLNNRSHDMEPVVADNLVGIVIAAFTPSPRLTAAVRRH